MAMSAVKEWFGRPAKPQTSPRPKEKPVAAIATPSEVPVAVPSTASAWTTERLATTDALWGEGYQFPGGEIETLRLAKPLGLSGASSLLLLGAGGGGAACSVATKLGAWVSGFETDPALVAVATRRIASGKLAKRIQIEAWEPETASFQPRFHRHALALEALRGARPEPALAAIVAGLKPNGQLMMVELIADTPLDPTDPAVASWARLEHRDPLSLPTETTITRTLGRLGLDVRVVEDVSPRHIQQALLGWRTSVRGMENEPPPRHEAMFYVMEAELWLLRLRLFQLGRLRLVRWYAIVGG